MRIVVGGWLYAESSQRDPLWVQLKDPVTGSNFWWHRRYRSRRESEPGLDDDGREGAFAGDAASAGPTWTESWSADHKRRFYVNNRDFSTQWERPDDFDATGVPFYPAWEIVKVEGEEIYMNRLTGEETKTKPADYDTEEVEGTISGPAPAPPQDLLDMLRVLQSGMRRYGRKAGFLEKKGGGKTIFGRRAWQRRYVALRDGMIQYFKTESDARKREARKDVSLDCDNYNCDPMIDDEVGFRLVPIHDKTKAAKDADPKHAPDPDRCFAFRAASREEKIEWVNALMDSESPFTVPEGITEARARVVSAADAAAAAAAATAAVENSSSPSPSSSSPPPPSSSSTSSPPPAPAPSPPEPSSSSSSSSSEQSPPPPAPTPSSSDAPPPPAPASSSPSPPPPAPAPVPPPSSSSSAPPPPAPAAAAVDVDDGENDNTTPPPPAPPSGDDGGGPPPPPPPPPTA